MDLEDSYTNTVSTRNTYYATVTIGKDDMIVAEYIKFNHSDWLEPKKAKTLKDKVKKIWDIITIPFWRIKHWVRDTYWKVHYGFERMFKGYDSVDTFETFAKFIERYEKVLTKYKEYNISHPCGMTEEEWDNIIDEMIYHLHYMDENNIDEELSKHVPEDWYPSWKTSSEIMEKHKNEFFKLFSEYFYNLWS